MVELELRRPRNGEWLHPLAIVTICVYHVHVRGTPFSPTESAFVVAMFALVTAGAFVAGLLDSAAYPLAGGGLIAAFYLLRFARGGGGWSLAGACAGAVFAGYGLYCLVR